MIMNKRKISRLKWLVAVLCISTLLMPQTLLASKWSEAPQSYMVGAYPDEIVRTDTNKDGNDDLIVFSFHDLKAYFFEGTPTGNFYLNYTIKLDDPVNSAAVGDYNKDGNVDIAISKNYRKEIGILLGSGNGQFQYGNPVINDENADTITTADFNNDGNWDLVVTDDSKRSWSLFLGRSDGNFDTAIKSNLGVGHTTARNVRTADFNNDGNQDLVFGAFGDRIGILLGNGDGSFIEKPYFNTDRAPRGIAIEDFNKDGNLDIAVNNYVGKSINVFLGLGNGEFQSSDVIPLNFEQYQLETGDFNGDQIVDIVAANGPSSITVLKGDGSGKFQSDASGNLYGKALSFATGDFDKDGISDIAVGTHQSSTLTVFNSTGRAISTDTEAPIWPNNEQPSVTNLKPTSATISWPKATDNVGVERYKIFGSWAPYPLLTVSGNVHSYDLTGLSPDNRYDLIIRAVDAANNMSGEIYLSVVTPDKNQIPDVNTPTWPEKSMLEVTNVTQTEVVLNWPKANAASGITQYVIEQTGATSNTITVDGNLNTHTITGLDANSDYSLSVKAISVDGKSSSVLSTTVKTLPNLTADAEAPIWPNMGTLKISNVTQTSAMLNWPAASDNVNVKQYNVYEARQITPITTVTSSVYSHLVTGLNPNSNYIFTVKAVDDTNNMSAELSSSMWTLPTPSSNNNDYVSSSSDSSWSSGTSSSIENKSSNSNLRTLSVRALDKELLLSPNFSPQITSYTIESLSDEIELRMAVEQTNATVSHEGKLISEPEKVKLKPGMNVISLEVKAQSGSAKIYTLNINVKADTCFKDTKGNWAEKNICEAFSLNMVEGMANQLFYPDAEVTRAQFVKMLLQTLNVPTQQLSSYFPFKDADQIPSWATAAVHTAVQQGMIQGYLDGTFRPNDTISRAEMAIIIAKAMKWDTTQIQQQIGFADDPKIPFWGRSYIQAVVQKGVMQGKSGHMFKPQDNTTRAEATTALLRLKKIATP
ncbi:FG-GAP-like repeat-containing protein [Paenibacillus sp. 481]|uniref:FG-GAP-like repeat-containing protein n=1 Tax=Paenibacillus sp. 481 TaxID=2835869 RepID=UPI001E321586|nr:FG-GAP-like repeat-containing protein [Paenibacillus sp. 481]UHA75054.1 VCBS repeat-containing protein [Paenibacillus sp. 481]